MSLEWLSTGLSCINNADMIRGGMLRICVATGGQEFAAGGRVPQHGHKQELANRAPLVWV